MRTTHVLAVLLAAAVALTAACGTSTGGTPPQAASAAPAVPQNELPPVAKDVELVAVPPTATAEAPSDEPSTPPAVDRAVDQVEAVTATEAEITPPAEATEELTTVTSEDGRFQLQYPKRLSQVNWSSYTPAAPPENVGRTGIIAFTYPGPPSEIRVWSTTVAKTAEDILATWRRDVAEWCPTTTGETQPYDDGRFRGLTVTVKGKCGDNDTTTVVAVLSNDGKFQGYFTLGVGVPQDIPAFGEAIRTFIIVK